MAMFVDARTRALQAASTDAVLPSSSDPVADLAAERSRAGFDVAELMRFLHGGQERIDRKARLAEMLQKTDWGNKSRRYFMTTEEQYVAGLQVAFGIRELVKEHGLSEADRRLLALMVALPGGLDVHDLMFVPCFIDHGTEEQQEKWVERARNCEVIGAYAQTELGHGTFVRGLETTATYDPERAEFILHSPTLTSTKWWPGGLGKTASHCILTARLFVKGVDRGPHVFVVQLRSMEDHKPLPGIMLGDIGPKFAYRGVDNGFLRFDHVRVPRDAMLMRFAKVTPGGEYVPPTADNAKSTYATMMYVRCGLAGDSARHLAMAVTIAVRYCAVRRQTAPSPGLKETQVLDYQSVSGTLLPLIATSFALHFSGKAAMASYHDFERRRDTGDFDGLAELHALSAGLKALCTWVTADGIEACRRSCGGHGYSRLSGLPDLYGFYVKNVTLEGENKVLCLQVGRHLIKALLAAQSGRPLRGAAAYLSDGFFEMSQLCAVDQRARWLDHGVQAEAFRRAAVQAVASAADLLREEGGGEVAFEGAVWNACNEAVIKAAVAHNEYLMFKFFMDGICDVNSPRQPGPPTFAVLCDLLSLFALDKLGQCTGDLLETGYVDAKQVKMMRAQRRQLLRSLRPQAVGLVEAFGFLDYELNSALGRGDGDVYRGLLEMAAGSPLNRTEEGPGWKPVLEARMRPRPRL